MIKSARRNWLDGIRKVVASPPAESLVVVPASSPVAKIGRIGKATITAEPGAMKISPTNPEEIWPYRRKELINRVNSLLSSGTKVGPHDIECIKSVYGVLKNPEFAFRPHSKASPQYSEAFASWIADQCKKDAGFLQKTRGAAHAVAKTVHS
jgi:hypothetical protein